VTSLDRASLSGTVADKEGPLTGRYDMRNGPGANLYLFDTITGDVWHEVEMIDVDGHPKWWVKMHSHR
jgi:hypothetical protein